MLEVSTGAIERLTGILDESGASADQCIRLTTSGEGELALMVDQRHNEDRAIANGERDVLVVEPALDAQLEGTVLTVSGAQQDQLTIEPKEAAPQPPQQNGTS